MRPIDATSSDLRTFRGTWVLDPVHTSITFRTKAMWVVPVKATAKALNGDARVSFDGAVSGTLVIDAASIDTKNKKRDVHLHSEDFFEVARFPSIIFKANSGRPIGAGRVEITGTLTIRDRTRPLILEAEMSASANAATVLIEIEIDRSLWGMSWAKMGTGLKNQVEVHASFDRTE